MGLHLRDRANRAKQFRCKNLIAVLENPKTIENIGSTVRNVDALGVQKLYVVDGYNLLPDNWQTMRGKKNLNNISVSAIKWAYVKRYSNTKDCLEYLEKKGFTSIVTSPHLKGKKNFFLEDADFTSKKVAIWFGNESRGVSDSVVDNSAFCVNIQMCGIIESLNLGTSTGIVLYEATKQRRNFTSEKESKFYMKGD
jgi:tRNA (guanosine-2'-O-)-methyltransferase